MLVSSGAVVADDRSRLSVLFFGAVSSPCYTRSANRYGSEYAENNNQAPRLDQGRRSRTQIARQGQSAGRENRTQVQADRRGAAAKSASLGNFAEFARLMIPALTPFDNYGFAQPSRIALEAHKRLRSSYLSLLGFGTQSQDPLLIQSSKNHLVGVIWEAPGTQDTA
jgi:hypothetical protein